MVNFHYSISFRLTKQNQKSQSVMVNRRKKGKKKSAHLPRRDSTIIYVKITSVELLKRNVLSPYVLHPCTVYRIILLWVLFYIRALRKVDGVSTIVFSQVSTNQQLEQAKWVPLCFVAPLFTLLVLLAVLENTIYLSPTSIFAAPSYSLHKLDDPTRKHHTKGL